MTDPHARTLFSIASAFNMLIGWSWLLAMPLFVQISGMSPPPADPVFVHLGAVLVIAFGWGYWCIAQDPVANRAIIRLGILGKSLVVIAGYYDWLAGNTNWIFAFLVTGDAIFAVLFYDYLRRHPVQEP